MDFKHGAGGFRHRGCKCDICREGNTDTVKSLRQRRYKLRSIVDGNWYAWAARKHGTASTYQNWGCRCKPCTEAASEGRWKKCN